MPGITIKGKNYVIPNVYSEVNVISDTGAPLPDFNIGLIVGAAETGTPWDFQFAGTTRGAAPKETTEDNRPVMKFFGNSSYVGREFGFDSDIYKAYRVAKRHGMPGCWVTAINQLERATANLLDATAAATIKVFVKSFGAPGNWIKVTVAASGSNRTVTVTPVKNYTMLTVATASGHSRLYVKSLDRLSEGKQMTLASNGVADEAVTIKSVGSALASGLGAPVPPESTGKLNYFVDLVGTVTGIHTPANYALLFESDSAGVEVSPAYTTKAEIIDWFNNTSQYVGAKDADAAKAIPAAQAATFIAEMNTPAFGKSPLMGAVADIDWTEFLDLLQATELKDFKNTEKLQMYCMLALTNAQTQHEAVRDFLIDRRVLRAPMQGVVGSKWSGNGNIVLTAGTYDTNPKTATATLNNQDLQFCSPGFDYLDGYLTSAPAVFGLRMANSVIHNLTKDPLIGFSKMEQMWDEDGSGEISSLLRSGVTTFDVNENGFFIVQGNNTYQNNAQVWDESTSSTYLVMQRVLSDYVDRTLVEGMSNDLIGEDEVDETVISAYMVRTLENLRENKIIVPNEAKGLPRGYKIRSVVLNSTRNGYDVDWDVSLRGVVDFIRIITNILV